MANAPRPGSKAARICDMTKQHPELDAGEIARKLGYTKQAVWNAQSTWRKAGYLPAIGAAPAQASPPALQASGKASERIKLALEIWNETGDYNQVAERLGVTEAGARIMIDGARRQNMDVRPEDAPDGPWKGAASPSEPTPPPARHPGPETIPAPTVKLRAKVGKLELTVTKSRKKPGPKPKARPAAKATEQHEPISDAELVGFDEALSDGNDLSTDDQRRLVYQLRESRAREALEKLDALTTLDQSDLIGLIEDKLLELACQTDTGAIDTIMERLSRLATLRAKLKAMK